MNWYELVGIGVAGIITLWGGLRMWAHIPREIGEALVALADYLEDPHPDEVKRKRLISEWGDVISLVRNIFGK